MQLKNLKTGGVCCCNSCDYDAWKITVSQSLVGYGGFVCEGSEPSDSRYLRYNVSCDAGFTGTWCQGVRKPEQVNVTTNIDPYTGLSCTQGLPPNGYVCGGGSNCEESCTETSRTYTCEAREEDCAGEGVGTIQTRYSLSTPNTKDDVINRARSLLNSYGVGSLPGPNTSGTVMVGSGGQSVLAWQAFSGEPTASRWTSRGVVELTKSIVKLKRDLRYKIVSYDEYGDKSEQEYDGVKDEVITLDPPNSDGSKYFRMPGGFYEWVDYDWEGNPYTYREEWDGELKPCPISPTTVEVESTNQLSTKTLRVAPPPGDGDEPEDQPCTSFFIGPDCKRYTQKVTNYKYNGSQDYNLTVSHPNGSRTEYMTFNNSGENTYTQTACSPVTTVKTSQSNFNQGQVVSPSGDFSDRTETCEDGSTTLTIVQSGAFAGLPTGQSSTSTFESQQPSCSGPLHCYFGFGGLDCNPVCGEDSNSWSGALTEGTTGSQSVQCWRDSYTHGDSSQTSSNTSRNPEPGWSSNGSSNCQGFIEWTFAWSGEVDESSFDDDDENARFETESWTQEGGLCAWKAIATNGTMNESTADITIYVSVDGDPQKNYRVEVQMVVESNTTQNNCSFRSYDSYVQTLTMKGGEVKQAGRYLSANNGQTKCMVHNAAVAYAA